MFHVEFAKNMFKFGWFYTVVCKMKTAKGKDKAKNTKEALKPVDDRLILCNYGGVHKENNFLAESLSFKRIFL